MRDRQRNIFFYRVDARDSSDASVDLDATEIAKSVERLEWKDNSRYMLVDEAHKIACWPISGGAYPRLAFGYIRPDDDVRIDNHGKLRPALTMAGDGLTEFTYVVLFPKGIAGVIFDAGGPRMKRISAYLIQKAPGSHKRVDFDRLVRKDMLQQLDRLGALTEFEMTVHPSQAGLFDDVDDSISSALRQLKQASHGDTIRIAIRSSRKKGASLGSGFRGALKKFLNKPIDRATVTRLRVTGRDSTTGIRVPPIDLLLKQYVFTDNVARPRSDTELAIDCFRAIEGQYARNTSALLKAAALKVDDE